MRLQTIHETRIAPPLITPQHDPTTVGNKPQALPQSQTKLPAAAQNSTHNYHNHNNIKPNCCVNDSRNMPPNKQSYPA